MSGGLTRFVLGELARLGLPQMWHLFAGAVVVVAAFFGGLDSVDAKPVVFKVGQDHSDGEFTVNVEKAVLLDEIRVGKRTVRRAEPGQTFLGLVSMVRNDGPIPGNFGVASEHLEFELQRPTREFLGAFRTADGSTVPSLGPKLSDRLLFLWKLPSNAITPNSSVRLRVWQKQMREMAVTYGRTWLASDTTFAQIDVPVRRQ